VREHEEWPAIPGPGRHLAQLPKFPLHELRFGKRGEPPRTVNALTDPADYRLGQRGAAPGSLEFAENLPRVWHLDIRQPVSGSEGESSREEDESVAARLQELPDGVVFHQMVHVGLVASLRLGCPGSHS
jgi:hypothetical protein